MAKWKVGDKIKAVPLDKFQPETHKGIIIEEDGELKVRRDGYLTVRLESFLEYGKITNDEAVPQKLAHTRL